MNTEYIVGGIIAFSLLVYVAVVGHYLTSVSRRHISAKTRRSNER